MACWACLLTHMLLLSDSDSDSDSLSLSFVLPCPLVIPPISTLTSMLDTLFV